MISPTPLPTDLDEDVDDAQRGAEEESIAACDRSGAGRPLGGSADRSSAIQALSSSSRAKS